MAWITPIYDRTATDVTNKVQKAYQDYIFYNRIEENTEYIETIATAQGYPLSFTTKYDWDNEDIQIRTNTERIIDNLEDIESTIPTATPSPPSDMRFLTFGEANDMEEILFNSKAIIEGIVENYLVASFSGGTDRTRQYLQRG